jgi:hypothetical protein
MGDALKPQSQMEMLDRGGNASGLVSGWNDHAQEFQSVGLVGGWLLVIGYACLWVHRKNGMLVVDAFEVRPGLDN